MYTDMKDLRRSSSYCGKKTNCHGKSLRINNDEASTLPRRMSQQRCRGLNGDARQAVKSLTRTRLITQCRNYDCVVQATWPYLNIALFS